MAKTIVSTYKLDGTPVGSDTAVDSPAVIQAHGIDVLKLRLNKAQLQGAVRDGNSLVIVAGTDENNDKIVIEDFFTENPKFVLEDEETGELAVASYDAENFDGLNFTPVESMDDVFTGTVSEVGGWVLPLVGSVAAIGGVAAIIANDDDSSNSNTTPVQPPEPTQPTTVWDVVKDFITNEINDWNNFLTTVTELPSVSAALNILNFGGSFIVGALHTGIWFVKALASPLIEGGKVIWDGIKLLGDLFVNGVEGFIGVIGDIFTGNFKPMGFALMIFDVFGNFLKDLVGIGVNALDNMTNTWKTFFDVGSYHFQNVQNNYEQIKWFDLVKIPFDFIKIVDLVIKGGIESAGDFAMFIKDAIGAFAEGGLGVDQAILEAPATIKGWIGDILDIVGILVGKPPVTPVEGPNEGSTEEIIAVPYANMNINPEGFVSKVIDFIKNIAEVNLSENPIDASTLVAEETTVESLLPVVEDAQMIEAMPELIVSSSEEALRALAA